MQFLCNTFWLKSVGDNGSFTLHIFYSTSGSVKTIYNGILSWNSLTWRPLSYDADVIWFVLNRINSSWWYIERILLYHTTLFIHNSNLITYTCMHKYENPCNEFSSYVFRPYTFYELKLFFFLNDKIYIGQIVWQDLQYVV